MLGSLVNRSGLLLRQVGNFFQGAEPGLGDPRRNSDEAIIQDATDFFFSDDFVTILDLVLSGSKNANIRDRVYASARTYRLPVESAWIDVLVKRGLPGADAEKVLWVTVSVVRGLALRALWQKDEALFRSVLDATKAMLLCHWDRVLKSKRGGKK